MLSFQQMFDKVNGPMYKDVPPPVSYNFLDYGKSVTQSPICGTEDGSHELRPLEPEDMARYGANDVEDEYLKLHNGKDPLRLGDPLTDREFKNFLGHTW